MPMNERMQITVRKVFRTPPVGVEGVDDVDVIISMFLNLLEYKFKQNKDAIWLFLNFFPSNARAIKRSATTGF